MLSGRQNILTMAEAQNTPAYQGSNTRADSAAQTRQSRSLNVPRHISLISSSTSMQPPATMSQRMSMKYPAMNAPSPQSSNSPARKTARASMRGSGRGFSGGLGMAIIPPATGGQHIRVHAPAPLL